MVLNIIYLIGGILIGIGITVAYVYISAIKTLKKIDNAMPDDAKEGVIDTLDKTLDNLKKNKKVKS